MSLYLNIIFNVQYFYQPCCGIDKAQKWFPLFTMVQQFYHWASIKFSKFFSWLFIEFANVSREL